ncbi:uncharacterized protein CDAR_492371 [Caerostris darwini]|uniref:SMB domain-containing protein n=1 Tax=Caerostris darwini TaxID=1538125 RepID=A0AAV4UZK2_9ARAC|nr:uncharacterized protein CDAR_492371 [Caerostris darwini]
MFSLVCLLNLVSRGETVQLEPGSCSQECRNPANNENSIRAKCSCSSSCTVYGDCCYDSPYRNRSFPAGRPSPSDDICIVLSTRGSFLAVAKCPRTWLLSSQFCTQGLGHLPPVTSMVSGTTYANIHCAICNGDGEDVTMWNVRLSCCSEHDNLDGRRYVYQGGYLWSKVAGHRDCPCSYVAHYNDASFADSLELRACEMNQEITKCSRSWRDRSVQQLCKSFLDPVYISNRIYRNLYCAQCNYRNLHGAKCMAAIVEEKLSEGLSMSSIRAFCSSHQISSCLNYFSSFGRGRSYTFSSLMNIREVSCLAPQCCDGQRYDAKYKRCRQLF